MPGIRTLNVELFSDRAFHRKFAVHCFHQTNGKSEPRSGGSCGLMSGIPGLNERVKNASLHVGWNAASGIGDRNLKFSIRIRRGNSDGALISELDGISDQVEQDLAEAVRIQHDRRYIGSPVDQFYSLLRGESENNLRKVTGFGLSQDARRPIMTFGSRVSWIQYRGSCVFFDCNGLKKGKLMLYFQIKS